MVFCIGALSAWQRLYKPLSFMELQRLLISLIWYESCTVTNKAWAD